MAIVAIAQKPSRARCRGKRFSHLGRRALIAAAAASAQPIEPARRRAARCALARLLPLSEWSDGETPPTTQQKRHEIQRQCRPRSLNPARQANMPPIRGLAAPLLDLPRRLSRRSRSLRLGIAAKSRDARAARRPEARGESERAPTPRRALGQGSAPPFAGVASHL